LPVHLDPHPFALSVVKGTSVIFVEQKGSIATGINGNGDWLLYFFCRELFYGTERKYGTSPNIKGYRFKIDVAADFAPAFKKFLCPKILPAAHGQIDGACLRAFFNDWCNEDALAP
jgi:hypothetical protein